MTELLDFSIPAGGFGGPVALWLACHQRLEGVCGLLRRFGAHVADFGTDEASRVAAEGLRRYFNVAAARHEDDENLDLFPRTLERLKGRKRATVRSLMQRLQDDHVAAARLWRPLDEQLAEVQRGGRASPDQDAIGTLVEQFLGHRRAEEEALLAVIRSALLPEDLTEIGEAMAARRGLTWKQLNAGSL
jgi:pyridoxamine 5'-phosphate oxidase